MSSRNGVPARSFYFLVRSKAPRLIGHLPIEDLFSFRELENLRLWNADSTGTRTIIEPEPNLFKI